MSRCQVLPKIDIVISGVLKKLIGEVAMKKMIVGMMLGATVTAIVTCGGAKCIKRAKKKVVAKIEKLFS